MNSSAVDGELSLSLTDAQTEVMSICMVISGLLSMFGSTTIVYRVIKKKGNTKPFDRIMLGLSSFDIIGSFSFVLTPFALPAATSPRVWAAGNHASCSFLGYLSQLSIGAAWYSCILSFYFLATLRLRVPNDDFAVRFEPYIHFLSIFYFLFTATMGVPFNLYSETELGKILYRMSMFRLDWIQNSHIVIISTGLGCWVTNTIPFDCTETDDCIGHIVAWFYGGLCLFFTMFALPLNYSIVSRCKCWSGVAAFSVYSLLTLALSMLYRPTVLSEKRWGFWPSTIQCKPRRSRGWASKELSTFWPFSFRTVPS